MPTKKLGRAIRPDSFVGADREPLLIATNIVYEPAHRGISVLGLLAKSLYQDGIELAAERAARGTRRQRFRFADDAQGVDGLATAHIIGRAAGEQAVEQET